MEISNLLNKITGQQEKSQEKEYFWALQVGEREVRSAIWVVEDGKTRVVALGSRESWQGEKEELVAASDRSLSVASEEFIGDSGEPSKVVFGLLSSWVEGEKITSSRQQMLKAVCEKLGLSPVGFVLTLDAINHHLKNIEGTPPSLILVNPQEEQVLVSVLDLGEVKGTERVRRSQDLAADVYEGLLRFGEIKTLPPRMLLFDGKEMEDARQSLTTFSWQKETEGKKLTFLHVPKIEALPRDFDITAVAVAGGNEVAKSLGFELKTEAEPQEAIGGGLQEGVEKEEENKEVLTEGSDLGFVQGEDIKQSGETGREETVDPSFSTSVEPIITEVEPDLPFQSEEVARVEEEPREMKGRGFPFLIFSKVRGIFPTFSLPFVPHLPAIGVIIGAGVLIVAVSLVAFFWYFPKAQVLLTVTSKLLEKEFEVVIDPSQEVIDEEHFVLPGRMLETEVSGQKSGATTGKITVGDKAEGSVELFNIGATRKLTAGTTLTGPSGLKFTLDEAVTIASGSTILNPGKATASITAAEIGAEHNLAAGAEFSVGNLDKSSLVAQNGSALTGGTSRQIQAVSEEDQMELLDSLTEELEEEAKSVLLTSVPSGSKLIDESIISKESSRQFDHDEGDEASVLNLSLKLKINGLVFSEDQFLDLIEKQISDSVPEGYEARRGEIEQRFEFKKENEDGSVIFKVFVKANLLPQFNTEEIVGNIKGKYPDVAREYLASLPGYLDVEIKITPRLPSPFLTLPRIAKNIQIEVTSR